MSFISIPALRRPLRASFALGASCTVALASAWPVSRGPEPSVVTPASATPSAAWWGGDGTPQEEAAQNEVPRPRPGGKVGDLLDRARPEADEWVGEIAGDRIGAELKELVAVWSAGEALERATLAELADELCIETFRGRWPEPFEVDARASRRSASFDARSAGEPLARSGRAALVEALADWADVLGGARRMKLKTIAVESLTAGPPAVDEAAAPSADDGATHRVELVASAFGVAGGEWRQIDARWRTRWRVGDGSPRWTALEIEDAELVRGLATGGPHFVDRTAWLLGVDGPRGGAAEPSAPSTVGASDGSSRARDSIETREGSDPSGSTVLGGLAAGPRRAGVAELLGTSLAGLRARLDRSLGVGLLGHHGLAIGDFDGDGLEDLYLPQPGGVPNLLLLATPDGRVREEGAERGVDFLDMSRSALALDLDSDSDLDLVVSLSRDLLFLRNDGHGHFERVASVEAPNTTSLAAADIDRDGDLDLYVCGYVSVYDDDATPVPYHDANNGQPNTLLLNTFVEGGRADWGFVDVTEAAGLDVNNRRFSFAASFEDYDRDGDPDLYVANDFGRNNLYRNDGDRFVDVAAEAGVEDLAAGMGVSWGDYDGDGWVDLYVSNMWSSAGKRMTGMEGFQAESSEAARAAYRRHARGNSLWRNLGDGRFEDVSEAAGVTLGRWAWGSVFADLDDDAWRDLVVPNGFVTGEAHDDL